MSGEELLHKIYIGIGELNGKFDGIAGRIDRHEKTIYGNGAPGLVARVSGMESDMQSLRGTESDAKTARNSAKTSVIAAVVTAALGALATALGVNGQK